QVFRGLGRTPGARDRSIPAQPVVHGGTPGCPELSGHQSPAGAIPHSWGAVLVLAALQPTGPAHPRLREQAHCSSCDSRAAKPLPRPLARGEGPFGPAPTQSRQGRGRPPPTQSRQREKRRQAMAKFKVVTHKLMGASFGVSGEGYKLEMEALAPIDAEIMEVPATTEDEFVRAARDADAIIAKGVPISKRIIDSLEQCKVIALGSVGADSVDVAAATARHIPVTNVPDTFIEEVADHVMMLILATFRRLTT